jgi:tRNA (guanine37-N1)-methyltransferase
MRIDILTLFPPMFAAPFGTGIFKRAIDNGLVQINLVNIRDYTHDKHHTADDYPYGGGAGMVLKPEPIFEAAEAVMAGRAKDIPVILLSPQGRLFSHAIAKELSLHQDMILICGHYEGIDERVAEHLATDVISIGDYVLTGGEVPALVVADAVLRLVPGVLGSEESPLDDSHASGLLEYPQYTRPPQFRDWAVPDVLLSGNHAQIAKWRREQIIKRTLEHRPELLDKADLGQDDRKLVERITHSGQKDK